jgi:MATE family multidrug resistance protein
MHVSQKKLLLLLLPDIKLPSLHQDSFISRFLRLALVNVLSNLMVPLSGFLSIAFLGHLGELQPLAGVTLATILFNYLYRTLGFLRMSTTGVTAQAMGKSDAAAAWLILLRHALLALVMGLAVLIFAHPLQILGFSLLSAVPEVKAAGQAYYDARIWGVPAALLNFVFIGWFLGREESGKVLVLSAVGNGANILLDYLLIVRLGLNSAGAGMATAISQSLMCLVALAFVLQAVNWQELRGLLPQLLDTSTLKDALRLNRDIFIRTLAFLSTFSLFTNLSSAMGTETLAENALLLQVITLAVYLVDGLAYATESLAGNLKGQGSREQLLPLLRIAGGSSLAVGLSCAGAFVLFPTPLFGMLTNHGEILARLNGCVSWLLPVLGFGSLAFMLDGYFLGLAEGSTLRNAAVTATLVGFAPIAALAWYWHSSYLLWLSLASFMAARALLLIRHVPRTLKIMNCEL